MTILVDMDDTIVNTTFSWVDCVNKAYGTNVRAEELTDWDVSVSFPTLTKAQVYCALLDENLWRNLKPLPGAVEYLKKLKEDGHTVFIVSNSHYKGLIIKMEEILFRFFPFLTWDDVILTSHKQLIKGDILVDDGPQNHIGGEYRKLLFTCAHNREFDAKANGMVRVNSWEEAYAYITQLQRENSVKSYLGKEIHTVKGE